MSREQLKTGDYLGIDAIWAYLQTQRGGALAAGEWYRAAEIEDVLGMIAASIEHFAWCEKHETPPPTRPQHRARLHRTLAEYLYQYDIPLPPELALALDYTYSWPLDTDGPVWIPVVRVPVVLPECQEWSAAGTRRRPGTDLAALAELLAEAVLGVLEKVVDGYATGHYLMQCGCCDRETAVPVAAYANPAISSWPCPACHPAGGVDLDHARRHAS
ncbi:MAG TPA: hypothetical protein VGL36_35610 [Kribbella sp.]